MKIRYEVEVDFGSQELRIGEVVQAPADPMSYGSARLVRVVDREDVGDEPHWLLDLYPNRPAGDEGTDEEMVLWPVAEDDALIRNVSLGESDAIPTEVDVTKWVTEGLNRDGYNRPVCPTVNVERT